MTNTDLQQPNDLSDKGKQAHEAIVAFALVYMDDGSSFFIENPPNGKPETWIDHHVESISQVEHVLVYEIGDVVGNWANPEYPPKNKN